jgi:hypothetical protein
MSKVVKKMKMKIHFYLYPKRHIVKNFLLKTYGYKGHQEHRQGFLGFDKQMK